jgi:DNA-binding NarL/FixJ family response regulator
MTTGASNREIARRLHLSHSTVKTHVERILAKLGATNRVQAVRDAALAGLV